MLTVDEVAERLGSGYETVRQLITAGELKATNISVKTRKVWRVEEGELEKFIKKGGVV